MVAPTDVCVIIFLDCRGRHPWRPVYKNIVTGFGENFDILLVGEDIILPLFIKNHYVLHGLSRISFVWRNVAFGSLREGAPA